MAKKTYVYLKDDLAAKLEEAAAETNWTQQDIIQELVELFLDSWLAAERAKLETIRQLTQPIQTKKKK
jgi:hypothetical protein